MPTPGLFEIIIVLVIVLVVFGPKRLPDLGRSLGKGMREFKDSVTGKDSNDELPTVQQVTPVEPPEPAPTATTTASGDPKP